VKVKKIVIFWVVLIGVCLSSSGLQAASAKASAGKYFIEFLTPEVVRIVVLETDETDGCGNIVAAAIEELGRDYIITLPPATIVYAFNGWKGVFAKDLLIIVKPRKEK
jgi:hypothetical protein